MNTESKSPSIPATPMGEDTPSSDESTSPPWYTSEPKGSMVNFGSPTELPQIYDEVEVLTCGQYVYQVYGLFGLNILEKVIIALEHPRVLNDYGIIQMGARPGWIDVLFLQDIPWVHTMLMWFCSAFRAPILGMVSLSYGTPEDTDVFELQPLEPLPVMSSIHHCCSALFGSAAIAARPGTDTTRELLLDIDRSIVGEYVRREYLRKPSNDVHLS
ncbi:hypothetical protein BDV38DRAFT_276495 [Aspergillus pseudotamarii]|uniref:Uncharacterized protein n=1 Tax=Aspergillus pseudotamarii TaxID=132259 RepID=A0A5N6SAA5_ASPPS|nr:uncharacterized protein BDV38DRAFT_276495 [Aspergillus pseudotamarii]KAE8130789.1 hypothetical protein BDV38DRAFT_276495 [Aspergillus pseudotamarii]